MWAPIDRYKKIDVVCTKVIRLAIDLFVQNNYFPSKDLESSS